MEPSTARTVPRYHRAPPWAVDTLSALSASAIAPSAGARGPFLGDPLHDDVLTQLVWSSLPLPALKPFPQNLDLGSLRTCSLGPGSNCFAAGSFGTLGDPFPPPLFGHSNCANQDNMWGGRRHDNHNT